MCIMKFRIILLILSACHALMAQEQLGLRLENYAGVSSLALNPAGNLTNPLRWDLNLAGAGIFFGNNYAYLRQTSTFDFLDGMQNADFLLAADVEGPVPVDTYIVDFNDPGRRHFASAIAYVEGPSLVVKIGDRHSVGVFTRAAAMAGTQDFPQVFNYYTYTQRTLFEPFEVAPFEGAAIGWMETGLNYALSIPTYSGQVGLGANVRFLQAYEGAYLKNLQTFDYTKLGNHAISFGGKRGQFGYTRSNVNGEKFKRQKNGNGMAFDLGAVLVLEGDEEKYKMRLGASLLDIGFLRFDKNARQHSVTIDSVAVLNLSDYDKYDKLKELDALVGQFSRQTMGDSLATLQGDAFTIAMPAAVSLQADYAFTSNVYVNAILVQRLPTKNTSPGRNNLLALTPRFEHRWFSASVPLVLLNWQDFRFGFAARLGFLVVGSDNVGSLFGQKNYSGTDLYFALKVNPFDLGLSLFGGGSRKRHFGKRGRVKCYDF
jgi:uncharacterized protein DUF5723